MEVKITLTNHMSKTLKEHKGLLDPQEGIMEQDNIMIIKLLVCQLWVRDL